MSLFSSNSVPSFQIVVGHVSLIGLNRKGGEGGGEGKAKEEEEE